MTRISTRTLTASDPRVARSLALTIGGVAISISAITQADAWGPAVAFLLTASAGVAMVWRKRPGADLGSASARRGLVATSVLALVGWLPSWAWFAAPAAFVVAWLEHLLSLVRGSGAQGTS